MDLNKLRTIGNNYLDVRLISLRDWRDATKFEPRDHGGPYMVMQEGYDPQDPTMSFDEFLLGKAGEWITVGVFLKLPKDVRRQEFVFGRAAEVMELLGGLAGKAKVFNKAQQESLGKDNSEDDDDLPAAFIEAKQKPASS